MIHEFHPSERCLILPDRQFRTDLEIALEFLTLICMWIDKR